MPRFQIVVGDTEVQKAIAYLVLVRGCTPEAAVESLDSFLIYTHDKNGESYYTFFESAEGSEIFTLKKKYRVLFGSGVKIIQFD